MVVKPNDSSSENVIEINATNYKVNDDIPTDIGTTGEYWYIIGGLANTGNAYKNILTINGGTGFSSTPSYYNVSKVIGVWGSGGTILGGGGTIHGGYANVGDATWNVITVNDGTFELVSGGSTAKDRNGNATNNTVNINGGNLDCVYGGYGNYSKGNIINISGGNVLCVAGGDVSTGTAEGNIVNISGGTIVNSDGAVVFGGIGHNATGNKINISGGTINGRCFGGFGYNAEGNRINISGGTINDIICAGHVSEGGTATNNTINISGNPNLSNAYLYGGSYPESTTNSGNTLNIETSGLTAQNIYYFQNINFKIPVGAVNGTTMLTLTYPTGTNLSGVAIKAGVQAGNTTLKNGDIVNLLTNANGITTDATTTYGKLTEGVSLTYDLTVSQQGNSIIAQIGNQPQNNNQINNQNNNQIDNQNNIPDNNQINNPINNIINNFINNQNYVPNYIQPLNEETKSIPQSTVISGLKVIDSVIEHDTLPNVGLDFDFDFEDDTDTANTSKETSSNYNADEKREDKDSAREDKDSTSEDEDSAQEIADVPNPNPPGWEIFADVGGGSLRTKTGGGSYVDTKVTNLDLGMARIINSSSGKLTFAPIVDYANGSYDSYLADGTHGTGSTKYVAGGGIFHNMWRNGFYVEGSFRIGKIKTDFASDNLPGNWGRVTYDTKATAMAGHLKFGRNIRLNKNNILDVYAAYHHAYQGSMDADLYPSGDKYRISSANSGRFKIGYRLTTRTSKISRLYTGLAYQYERATGITANYIAKNLSTGNGGESGSSGMLEIGWLIKPLKNNPWAVDINATGWIGHQRGVTAMAKISKSF